MNKKEIDKYLESSGTKITKEKLLDAIRKAPEKDFLFIKDSTNTYSIVRVKVQ